MRQMGVEVQIFNLNRLRAGFLENHPHLTIPAVFGEVEELSDVARQFDAAVATMNTSVSWLAPAQLQDNGLTLGYYVQDFEPMMYPAGSSGYQQAFDSYTLIPEMVLFTKTDWTRQQVQQRTGASCQVVGPSFDTDLFCPRPRIMTGLGKPPIRIGAMVRESSPYRSPKLTMKVLQETWMRYGSTVEILVFGTPSDDGFHRRLPAEFAWKMAGTLSTRQVARFVNELDIFLDFSSHQAMGLTAMEAMGCGAAVVVPSNGGATEFATHGENALVVDSTSYQDCLNSVGRLIEDQPLREKIQRNALFSISQFFPERAALAILKALFYSGNSS